MRLLRHRGAAIVAAGTALALTACSSVLIDATSHPATNTGIYVALVAKSSQGPFWQAVKQGAEDKAAELGVTMTFEGPVAETEVDAQLEMLQKAIDTQPSVIGYAALDAQACKPLFQEASADGIPIVEFDTPCNSTYASSLSATDNRAAGALAADHLAELIGGKGDVAVVTHSETGANALARSIGFRNEMATKYPDVTVVDGAHATDERASTEVTTGLLTAHPNLVGVFATNETVALGVVDAVQQAGLDTGALKIVGFNAGEAQLKDVRDGLIAGAVTQDPRGMGASVVQAAYNVASGQPVQGFYDTGSVWYDASNMDDPAIAPLLYS